MDYIAISTITLNGNVYERNDVIAPEDVPTTKLRSMMDRGLIDAVGSFGSGIDPTIVDAKGDLIAGTAADTVARLAAGTDGKVLSANSAEATGLEWVTPSAGGATNIDGLSDAYRDGTAKNLFVGREIPVALSGATDNVAISGDGTALDAITSGDENIAIGTDAGGALTTTGGNTAVGHLAAYQALGQKNTCLGYASGLNLTTGDNNVFIGNESGGGGSQNVAIGRNANLSGQGTGNVTIGDSAATDVFNRNETVVIGKSLTSSAENGSIAIGSNNVPGNVIRVVSGSLSVGGVAMVAASGDSDQFVLSAQVFG